MSQTEDKITFVLPDAYPRKCPKDYRHKRAVGLFLCWGHSFGPACHEILRAKMTASGGIYVIVRKTHFHESFPKNWKFHWTWEQKGKPIVPLYGEEDFPKAFKLWLKFRSPMCLCFRRGRSLGEEEITGLVARLAKYLPININLEEASLTLWKSGFYRLRQKTRLDSCFDKLPPFIRRWINRYIPRILNTRRLDTSRTDESWQGE